MKFIHITFLAILVSSLGSSCEKRLIDYRNKYTGDYNITYKTSWSAINGSSGSTSTDYTARVYYLKKEKGKIRMDYNNNTIVIDLDKKGNVLMCEDKTGKFNENDFAFSYYSCGGSHAHGGSGSWKYSGTKK